MNNYQVQVQVKVLETDGETCLVDVNDLTFVDYDTTVMVAPAFERPNIPYPALGALGEGAEVLEKAGQLQIALGKCGETVKKLWRDHRITNSAQLEMLQSGEETEKLIAVIAARDKLLKEAGDVLWYLNALVKEAGSSLSSVAASSIDKVHGRLERGTVLGSGDDR